MKYLLLSLFLLPLALMAQKNYAPLNTTWAYQISDVDCLGSFATYKVEQEITIDGKDCSVIRCYLSGNCCPEPLLVEDSLIVWENDNKVYFLEGDDFLLMYDFSAEIGDTITHYSPTLKPYFGYSYYTDQSTYVMVVTDIEIITLNDGTERKKFYIEWITPIPGFCREMSSYIEHIGSTGNALANGLCWILAMGCNQGRLQCYDNGDVKYSEMPPSSSIYEYNHPYCFDTDNSNDIHHSSTISLFPNPTTDEVFIEAELPILGVQIFNTNQQLIKTYSTTTNIQLKDFAVGVYIIGVQTKEGVDYFKLVKE